MAANLSLVKTIQKVSAPSPTAAPTRTSTVVSKVISVDLSTIRVSQGGSVLGISNVPVSGNEIGEVRAGDEVRLHFKQGQVYATLVKQNLPDTVVATVGSGLPTVNTQQVGNAAGTETDLGVNSIAVGILGKLGDAIEFRATGTFANTGSTDKRIRVRWGITLVFDSGALAITSANDWYLEGTIIRTGASSQKCRVVLYTSSSVLVARPAYSTAGEDLGSAKILKVTGQGTNASDVVGEIWQVKSAPLT